MNKPGLSLFEVLIYLLISMFIITGTSRVLFNLYTSLQSHRGRQESLIDLGCALGYVTRDLKNSYQEGGYVYKVLEPKRLIFSVRGKDYGWLIKKTKLMRYQGQYSVSTGSWKHLSVSMIASITGGTFIYTMKGSILIGIQCSLSHKTSDLSTFIAMSSVHE